MFSYIDVRCYHLTGDLNAWQSFVGNKAKSTCLCVSYNMICGKLQWWKLLWAILVICFLKSCVHYRLIVFKATVEWKLWLFIKYCLPCDEHICRIPHPFYTAVRILNSGSSIQLKIWHRSPRKTKLFLIESVCVISRHVK